MITLRFLLTRLAELPDHMGVWKPGKFMNELRFLQQQSMHHLDAANIAHATTIDLDKAPRL